jgi:hypothetical protein
VRAISSISTFALWIPSEFRTESVEKLKRSWIELGEKVRKLILINLMNSSGTRCQLLCHKCQQCLRWFRSSESARGWTLGSLLIAIYFLQKLIFYPKTFYDLNLDRRSVSSQKKTRKKLLKNFDRSATTAWRNIKSILIMTMAI